MPIETSTATPNWTGLEGKVLEGGYEIEKCLNAGETSASFKVRVLGDRFTSAVADVFAPGTVRAEQMALWKDAVPLRHPNVSSPMSVDTLDFNNAALPYRVLVRPDETLGGVIKERALTPEETREALTSVVSALEYLHGSGFAHTEVSPEQVLAIGDSVRLSTGSIRRINTPLQGEENPAPAADIFRLGATVFEVLTRKRCGEDCREESAKLPAPFDSIVHRCLDPDVQSRCTLADIRAMLAGRQLRAAVKPEPVRPAAVKLAPVAPPPLASHVESARRAQPPAEAPHLLRRERAEEARPSSPFKKSAFLLLALLLAVGVLWLARPKSSKPRPAVSATPSAPVAQTPAQAVKPPAATAWPTRAVGPDTKSSAHAAPRPSAKPAAAPPATKNGAIWRVVSFTYSRESDAQKRVDLVNSKHPDLHPEVFSPSGHGPYLVVLGGQMNREEAAKLRQKARAVGFPRDSYIQNYSR